MNVLFILADQHNPSFMGCYGGITRTPNLDALAADGVLFEHAYTPCPMCSPARGSLFSGRYVYENKCWDNCFPYDGEKLPGWGHYFRDKGVHFATIGKLDFKADRDNGVSSTYMPEDRVSYDVVSLFRKPPLLARVKYHMAHDWDVSVRKTNEHEEQTLVNEAKRWIREEMPQDKPWILNVNFIRPHSPWHPLAEKYEYYRDKIELAEKYKQPERELNVVDREQSRHTCGFTLDEEHLKDSHAAYHAIVEELDENVGAVIQALKDAGKYDDTLIIYSADHGEMMRAHGVWEKSTLYEDSIRIPMIIKMPGMVGKRINTPVSLLDVFPTVNDWFGYEEQEQFRGESLISLSKGNQRKQKAVFTESHANGRITGTFAVRKDNWKLMYYDGYGILLFDLEKDPQEMHNLATQSDNKEIQGKIDELMAELNENRDLHKITEEAFSAQEVLKNQLFKTGQLKRELNKRGLDYDGENLFYLP